MRTPAEIVTAGFISEEPVPIKGEPDFIAMGDALKARGLNGHWEGSLASWMWQVDGEETFWVSVPRRCRSRWYAWQHFFR